MGLKIWRPCAQEAISSSCGIPRKLARSLILCNAGDIFDNAIQILKIAIWQSRRVIIQLTQAVCGHYSTGHNRSKVTGPSAHCLLNKAAKNRQGVRADLLVQARSDTL
eukprot:9492304-Pyramimonas_sp.AAC.1